MPSRFTYILAALALIGAVCTSAAGTTRPLPVTTLEGTVTRVVDGDTIRISARGFETPVRLVGIDTPETRDPRRPIQCYGPQATAMTERLLPVGTRVLVQSDPTQAVRDRYGRFLGYVFRQGVPANPTRSVNHTLVRTGRAKVYAYGGVRFQRADDFFRAQHRARKARYGLWGPPCNGDTTKPDPGSSRPVALVSTTAGRCDPNYAGACVPPYPPDVDCGDLAAKRFRVVGRDVHHLDGDGDGVACEG